MAACFVCLFATASARAVQPDDRRPGLPRRPTPNGREQEGRTFRKPGTLLSQARHEPRQVDLEALRRRKLDQVTRGARHTRALDLATLPEQDLEEPRSAEDPVQSGVLPGDDGGVEAWHVLVFAAATAVALILALRFTGRRRREGR